VEWCFFRRSTWRYKTDKEFATSYTKKKKITKYDVSDKKKEERSSSIKHRVVAH
jgi:hypothetical protein